MSTTSTYKRRYTNFTTPVGYIGYNHVATKSQFGNFEVSLYLEDNESSREFIRTLTDEHQTNITHEQNNNPNAGSDIKELKILTVTEGGDFPESVASGTSMFNLRLRSNQQPTIISSDGNDLTGKMKKNLPRGVKVSVEGLLASFSVRGSTGSSMYVSQINVQENSN